MYVYVWYISDHFVIGEQDYTLSQSLIRVSSYYVADLQSQPPFKEARFGSVKKVYIICKKDVAVPEEHQRRMVAGSTVEEVRELDFADHMPMFSAPGELAGHLADVANTFAWYYHLIWTGPNLAEQFCFAVVNKHPRMEIFFKKNKPFASTISNAGHVLR